MALETRLSSPRASSERGWKAACSWDMQPPMAADSSSKLANAGDVSASSACGGGGRAAGAA